MKSTSVAWLLWALGFMGIGGLHRFYVGQKTTGWIYLLTFDLCFVGLLLDYKHVARMVQEANARLLPASTRDWGSPIVVNVVTNMHAAEASPREVIREVVKEVVKIRCSYCGSLTPQGTPKCVECGARV